MEIKIFTASWCSSCKVVKPLLTANNIDFTELSVDLKENADYAKSIGVRGLPTIIKVSNGEVVGKITGKLTEDQLQDFVK